MLVNHIIFQIFDKTFPQTKIAATPHKKKSIHNYLLAMRPNQIFLATKVYIKRTHSNINRMKIFKNLVLVFLHSNTVCKKRIEYCIQRKNTVVFSCRSVNYLPFNNSIFFTMLTYFFFLLVNGIFFYSMDRKMLLLQLFNWKMMAIR